MFKSGVLSITGSVLLLSFLPGATVVRAHEELEIVVGRTATGALVMESHFSQPVELPASPFPGISGYATGELAFHSTLLDDPANNLFQLAPTAQFRLRLLAKDVGVEIWNETGTGFMAINETFQVGPAPFDVHPIWNIPATPAIGSYAVSLQLFDVNGVYPESEPITLHFTPQPSPPPLRLFGAAPAQVQLAWPTNAVGWELQTAEIWGATTWNEVTNFPSVVGTNYVLTVDAALPQQFFRLHRH